MQSVSAFFLYLVTPYLSVRGQVCSSDTFLRFELIIHTDLSVRASDQHELMNVTHGIDPCPSLLWAGILTPQSICAAVTYIRGQSPQVLLHHTATIGYGQPSSPLGLDVSETLWVPSHTQSFSTSTEGCLIPRVVHGSPQTFVLMEGGSGLAVRLTVARHPAKPC